jgi:hypothetical protein
MVTSKQANSTSQMRSHTGWAELDYLCKKLHYWLHVRKEKGRAKRFLPRLERVLEELPENDLAIDRAEGLALFHELKGNNGLAIKYRRREIELIEMAHKSVGESLKAGHYGKSTAASILADRNLTSLAARRAILKGLIGKEHANRKRDQQ